MNAVENVYKYTYQCILYASSSDVCVWFNVHLLLLSSSFVVNVFIISVFVGFCLWVMMEKYDFIVCSPVLIISMRFNNIDSLARSLVHSFVCSLIFSIVIKGIYYTMRRYVKRIKFAR